MTSNMAAPYSLTLEILRFLNHSYFVKIITREPKIGNLTNMTGLYPFLETKKRYLLFKGILWSRDATWKPRIVTDPRSFLLDGWDKGFIM